MKPHFLLFSLIGVLYMFAYTGAILFPIHPQRKDTGIENRKPYRAYPNRVRGRQPLGTTTATDGKFHLEGHVESPAMCRLEIRGDKDDIGYSIDLMLENGTTDITVAHIDSMPPSFTFLAEEVARERHVAVKGGRAQQEFAEYRKVMRPYELDAKRCHYDYYIATDQHKRSKEQDDSLQARFNRAEQAVQTARRDFITRHPDYAVSAYLWCEQLNAPFAFTTEELDHITKITAGNRDTARLAELHKVLEQSRKFVKGLPYTDFQATDTCGHTIRLSDCRIPGHYLFVDFWASWCGPCRAAIPHVRELYSQYSDRMDICSVSLDSKDSDWQRAMSEEKMEWTQLWLPKDKVKAVQKAYSIRGIPFLLLVNPQGEILYGGHSATEAADILQKHLNPTF